MFFNASRRKSGIISIELLAFLTSCSLWKTTTLPPLSPVANSSPVELNSTVEIMSATTQEAEQRERENVNMDLNKPGKVKKKQKKTEEWLEKWAEPTHRGIFGTDTQFGEIWVRRNNWVSHCMKIQPLVWIMRNYLILISVLLSSNVTKEIFISLIPSENPCCFAPSQSTFRNISDVWFLLLMFQSFFFWGVSQHSFTKK